MQWKPPSGLGIDAKLAFLVAAESVDYADDRRMAVERFAHAIDLASLVRREWKKAGRPLTLTQPNGMCGTHPLVKTLADSEAAAARAEREVFPRRSGNVGPRSPDRQPRVLPRPRVKPKQQRGGDDDIEV